MKATDDTLESYILKFRLMQYNYNNTTSHTSSEDLYSQMSVLCRWLFLISALTESTCSVSCPHHVLHMSSLWEWKWKRTAASILKLGTFLFKNNHANHKRWQLCNEDICIWLSTESYLQVMCRIQENVCGFHANTIMPLDIKHETAVWV